jgi:hypothetical protein
MAFYESFLSLLEERYPTTARTINVRERLTPLLFCPVAVKLSRHLADKARLFAEATFALREIQDRKTKLENLEPHIADPGNYSALMSYDFHVDAEGRLRLIEINTNAAMSLMSDLLYEAAGLQNGFSVDFKREIIDTFKNEFTFAMGPSRKLERAVIVDEKPETQRAFVEFHAYRELFERDGIEAFIADPRDLEFANGELRLNGKRIDLVYNRDTDFYLEGEGSRALRYAMEAKTACISPHAHEYRLLADKARLMELSAPSAIESLDLSEAHKAELRSAIIPAFSVRDVQDTDALWAERKKLFFKPKRSFGGKAVYRGDGISRGVFARILEGDYLAQEFVPPATLTIPIENESRVETFKYDLRFYAYRDRIQLACARLYHGQMTNSHTPGGGIAAIEWV